MDGAETDALELCERIRCKLGAQDEQERAKIASRCAKHYSSMLAARTALLAASTALHREKTGETEAVQRVPGDEAGLSRDASGRFSPSLVLALAQRIRFTSRGPSASCVDPRQRLYYRHPFPSEEQWHVSALRRANEAQAQARVQAQGDATKESEELARGGGEKRKRLREENEGNEEDERAEKKYKEGGQREDERPSLRRLRTSALAASSAASAAGPAAGPAASSCDRATPQRPRHSGHVAS